jgi:hypothetical protein
MNRRPHMLARKVRRPEYSPTHRVSFSSGKENSHRRYRREHLEQA